jgi:ligand-binding sensor domain-containing protein
MLWFYDSSGKVFYAGNVPFLVRDEYNWVTLLDSNNKNIVDSNNFEVMTY